MVAAWYAEHIWPAAHVERGSGSDILGVPLDIEVKGRRGFAPLDALRQALKRRKPEHVLPPHVVMRMEGQAGKSVAAFMVIRRLDHDTEVLAELLSLRAQVSELESQKEFDQDRLKTIRGLLTSGPIGRSGERYIFAPYIRQALDGLTPHTVEVVCPCGQPTPHSHAEEAPGDAQDPAGT